MSRRLLAVVSCVLGGSAVALAQPAAQPPPPRGPAEIVQRAQQKLENPHAGVAGADPHAGVAGAPPLSRPPASRAEPSSELPAGTVRVRVVDPGELPAKDAQVQLGTMGQDSTRSTLSGRTTADGVAVFSGLPTGDKQAYRVNVPYEGAKYSSTPFRLPPDQGYAVTIRRLPTTRDDKELVLYVGATSVELKDERLRLVQQARLYNVGRATYVFPADGLHVTLPKGALAFQSEDLMTDQQLREADRGFAITGSVPPGEVTLTWAFDLPLSGTQADIELPIPWTTYAYRVLVDAAQGLRVSVDGLPAPALHDGEGRRYFVTEVMKSPGDPPLRKLVIRLRGIPGPGPLRWIALAVACFVLVSGLVLARRPPGRSAERSVTALSARKRELLAAAAALAQEHARGEVGPEYLAAQRAELEEQLAVVLYESAKLRAHI